MEKIIKVATNRKVITVDTKETTVNLPEVNTFYSKNDEGRLFNRGLVLFAMIPRYKTNPTNSYTLVEIERNKQDYNDWVQTNKRS
jgi:hypothetical protein